MRLNVANELRRCKSVFGVKVQGKIRRTDSRNSAFQFNDISQNHSMAFHY